MTLPAGSPEAGGSWRQGTGDRGQGTGLQWGTGVLDRGQGTGTPDRGQGTGGGAPDGGQGFWTGNKGQELQTEDRGQGRGPPAPEGSSEVTPKPGTGGRLMTPGSSKGIKD